MFINKIVLLFILAFGLINFCYSASSVNKSLNNFPVDLEHYSNLEMEYAKSNSLELKDITLFERLKIRSKVDIVNVLSTLLFFGAIVHTFAAGYFMKLSHQLEKVHKNNIDNRRYWADSTGMYHVDKYNTF